MVVTLFLSQVLLRLLLLPNAETNPFKILITHAKKLFNL